MRMQKGFDLCADVLFKLKRLINHSDLLVKKLHEVADELDSHHYNSAIAKVTGGAAGIAGVLTGQTSRLHVYACRLCAIAIYI